MLDRQNKTTEDYSSFQRLPIQREGIGGIREGKAGHYGIARPPEYGGWPVATCLKTPYPTVQRCGCHNDVRGPRGVAGTEALRLGSRPRYLCGVCGRGAG